MINIKTNKYNNMISAFQCDLSLAKQGRDILLELDDKIKKNDLVLLKDIELLEELEWLLRMGKVEIHVKE